MSKEQVAAGCLIPVVPVVLIAEDHQDIRQVTKLLLEIEGCSPIEAANGLEALQAALSLKLHLILMDIDMPKVNGMEAVWQVKKQFPDVQILMLTAFDDNDFVFRSICAGASGYLLKRTPPEKIVEAIFELAAGGGSLTSSIARKVLDMFRPIT